MKTLNQFRQTNKFNITGSCFHGHVGTIVKKTRRGTVEVVFDNYVPHYEDTDPKSAFGFQTCELEVL